MINHLATKQLQPIDIEKAQEILITKGAENFYHYMEKQGSKYLNLALKIVHTPFSSAGAAAI